MADCPRTDLILKRQDIMESFNVDDPRFSIAMTATGTDIPATPKSRSISVASRAVPRLPCMPRLPRLPRIPYPPNGILPLVAGFCQQILCWGMIMGFGTTLSYYAGHLMPNVNKLKLSLIGAIPPFFLLFLALIWGRLLDAGHHRWLNFIAALCILGGLVGLVFAGGQGEYGNGKYGTILGCAFPLGIGQSIYFLAAPHMAKTWYPKRKGFAMGCTNSGAALGGAIFPYTITRMIEKHGFQEAMALQVGIAGALVGFIWVCAVPARDFEPRTIGRPSTWSWYTWWPQRALRSSTFCVHVVAMCCIYLSILTIPFNIEMWAKRHHNGISEDEQQGHGINFGKSHYLTVYLVVILNSSQFVGRWAGSTLCDQIPARRLHCGASIAIAILIYPFWLKSTSFDSAAVFAAFFGVLLGVMVSLPVNDAQEILGNDRTRLFGQYSGAVYTLASPFVLSGAIISGHIVDAVGEYEAGVYAASVFMAGGFLILLSLLIPNDNWKFDADGEAARGPERREPEGIA